MHCPVSLPPLRRRPPGWLRLRLILAALCLGGAAVFAGDETTDPATPLSREQAFALALEAHTARDRAAVLHWLRIAATDGLVPAQEMLGATLLSVDRGDGAPDPREICEAREWFHRAALQGSAIGRMHRDLLNRSPAGRRCG